MAYSKVGISNMALALLGAASIRDFTENNKRARMADVLFEPSRDLLLAKFDWPFARAYKELNQLDLSAEDTPWGEYGYALPSDIITPRDIWPSGSNDSWHIIGEVLFCNQDAVGLFYTARVDSAAKYSHTFADLLALRMAIKMGPAITQDKRLVAELKQQYKEETFEAWEADANIGNDYRTYNEDPENDTFVNPDRLPTSGIPRVIT